MFPTDWLPRRIIDAAQQIKDDASIPAKGQPSGVHYKHAIIERIDVRLKIAPSGVQTFYPRFGPGVTWSWGNRVFPQETLEQLIENQERISEMDGVE